MSVTFYAAHSDAEFAAQAQQPHATDCYCGKASQVSASYEAALQARRNQDFAVCGDEQCFEEYLYGFVPSIYPLEPFAGEELEVNVSNTNALHLLRLLGILADDADEAARIDALAGELPAQDLLGRALIASAFAGEGDDAPAQWLELPRENGGLRVITQVRDGRYDTRQLGRLADLARWCSEHGRAVAWA
jgi:hypothetical protein